MQNLSKFNWDFRLCGINQCLNEKDLVIEGCIGPKGIGLCHALKQCCNLSSYL